MPMTALEKLVEDLREERDSRLNDVEEARVKLEVANAKWTEAGRAFLIADNALKECFEKHEGKP